MQRVDPKKLEVVVAESVEAPKAAPAEAAPVTVASGALRAWSGSAQPEGVEDDGAALAAEPLAAECTFEDFAKGRPARGA